MASNILHTKLFPPALRPKRVMRDALLQRLMSHQTGKLTLVSAPAGFGKSTLLAEWVKAQSSHVVAWVSLDRSDSQPSQCLLYLVTSIRKALAQATFGEECLALVQNSAEEYQPHAVFSLINDLAGLEQSLLLILDDYHLLEGGQIDALIRQLVDRLPPQVHLAIGSREDPALGLAKMRASGDLNEIRAADLRFKAQESSSFLNEAMALSLSDEDVAALGLRTEGWVAGLQLAAVSLQNTEDKSEFIRTFAGSHRFVLDYLTEEVLANQPENIRQFLMKVSVLEQFNLSLCERITGFSDCQDILRQLEQENLFLIGLDHQGDWFRFHHLFADMLRAHRTVSDNDIRALHKEASHWYLEQDEYTQAILHALQSKDYDWVAELLERYWPLLRFCSLETDFVDWVSQMPERYWICRPVVATYHAMACLSQDRDRGERELAAVWQQVQQLEAGALAEESVRVSNPEAMRLVPGIIAIGQAYLAGAEADAEQIFYWTEQALDRLPERDLMWRGAALGMRGMLHWAEGNLNEAVEAMSQCLDGMEASGDLSGIISSYYVLASARHCQGMRDEAERLVNAAMEELDALEPFKPQGAREIWVVKAELALDSGDRSQAEDCLLRASRFNASASLLEAAHHYWIVKAEVASNAGQHHQALAHLKEAERVKLDSPRPDAAPIFAIEARLRIAAGQTELALAKMQEAWFVWDAEPTFLLEYQALTLVRIWLAQSAATRTRSIDEVVTLLEGYTRPAIDQGRLRAQIEIRLLLAMVLTQNAENSEACQAETRQHLVAAIELAQATGCRLEFEQLLVSSPEFGALLDFVAKSREQPEALRLFVRTLLNARLSDSLMPTGQTQQTLPDQQALAIEPLSERERDVLQLLATDKTGPQIADSLFISLNTFRTHTKNIYAKLGVSNRQGAIRKSQTLGLLNH